MVRTCAVYGCNGNYAGTPYTKMVSFPKDPQEREEWILSMPNDASSLRDKKDIFICENHFDCDWINVRGGRRPSQPPSVFRNVPKSCMKQTTVHKRSSVKATSSSREDFSRTTSEARDKILTFDNFATGLKTKYPDYNVTVAQRATSSLPPAAKMADLKDGKDF